MDRRIKKNSAGIRVSDIDKPVTLDLLPIATRKIERLDSCDYAKRDGIVILNEIDNEPSKNIPLTHTVQHDESK